MKTKTYGRINPLKKDLIISLGLLATVLLISQILVSIQIKQAFNSMTTNHQTTFVASSWLTTGAGIQNPNNF